MIAFLSLFFQHYQFLHSGSKMIRQATPPFESIPLKFIFSLFFFVCFFAENVYIRQTMFPENGYKSAYLGQLVLYLYNRDKSKLFCNLNSHLQFFTSFLTARCSYCTTIDGNIDLNIWGQRFYEQNTLIVQATWDVYNIFS